MATITGTIGNDMLTGTSDADLIEGLDGSDTLDGGLGDDTINGGAGDDFMFGGGGNNLFIGGTGADRVTSDLTTTDRYEGGVAERDELIYSGPASGQIRMTFRGDGVGDGNILDGGNLAVQLRREDASGAATGALTTLDDEDVVIVAGLARGAILDIRDVDGTELGGFEVAILGGQGADNLTARVPIRPHYFNGGQGNDTYGGGTADDLLIGGAGDDSLTGNGGNDRYRGGDGADLIVGGAGIDSALGGEGNDRLFGRDGADDMIGGGGDDLVNGEAGNDRLFGAAGADVVSGELGDDLLNGEAGDDVLLGGAGADLMSGEAGADVLIGEAGADVMIGGAGADRFVYTLASDSGPAALDVIADFSLADGDRVDVSAIDANSAVAGDQAFVLVSALTGVAGQATLSFNAATGRTTFLADIDGNGVADFGFAMLGNVAPGAWLVL